MICREIYLQSTIPRKPPQNNLLKTREIPMNPLPYRTEEMRTSNRRCVSALFERAERMKTARVHDVFVLYSLRFGGMFRLPLEPSIESLPHAAAVLVQGHHRLIR